MIPHHRQIMEMSEMALRTSSQPDVRKLAQDIIDDQGQEIILMTAYLGDWYGLTSPKGSMMPPEIMECMEMPMLRGLMPDMEERMRELEAKSGADFDIAYLSSVIDHHGMALMMVAPMLVTAYHGQLYDLGAQIAIGQGMQIREVKRMLRALYGVEHPE